MFKIQEHNYDGDEYNDTRLPLFETEAEAIEHAERHYATQIDTAYRMEMSERCACQDCAEEWRVQRGWEQAYGCRVVQVCPDCEEAVPADDNGEPLHPDNNCFYATV